MEYIEPILYTDPQAQSHRAVCPVCGGVVYAPSLSCIRCGRDKV